MTPVPISHAKSPILIAGPTASGKSRLALELARTHGGFIINADSMQVYRELSVLTARPTMDDEAKVPHKLYGHVPAREAYSAGRFITEASAAIAAADAQGLRPIITGGTGLYFKALLEGLSPIPSVPDPVRAFWRAQGERLGGAELHARLARLDEEMAQRLRPSDVQRVVRALEVLEATGRSLAYWQAQPGTPVIGPTAVKLRISRSRADLYARADRRFDEMMAQGALQEAEALAALKLAPDLPAMRALGVGPLVAAVQGRMSLAHAVEQAKVETRQYIKRQETWAKRYMISWKAIST